MWMILLAATVAAPKPAPPAKNPHVVIETSKGTITAELYQDKAPMSVKNFLTYVHEKFYDGTIFHRVIPNFMIQGGGFGADMTEKKTHAPIKNEAGNGLSNERGTLAMARTQVPDSATAQFYINLKDNGFLDRAQSPDGVGYAVFGKVLSGMEVVDAIATVSTTSKPPYDNVPVQPVVIKSIRVTTK
jgi:cyclophilin family peptidyl-prolyl cis-trans isomerase